MESNWNNTSVNNSVPRIVRDGVWFIMLLGYGVIPGEGVGSIILYIISCLLGVYVFGKLNVVLASRMNGTKNIAFVIGALGGVFGTLLYWIYYRLKLNRK